MKRAFGADSEDESDQENAYEQHVKIVRKRAAQQESQAVEFDFDQDFEKPKAAPKPTGPKYLDRILEAKRTRELDRSDAQTAKLKRERLLEGDQFEGKEEFVTKGYREYVSKEPKAVASEGLQKGIQGVSPQREYVKKEEVVPAVTQSEKIRQARERYLTRKGENNSQ